MGRPTIFVNPGVASTLLPSQSTTDTLVIFVHGFRGTATGTWLSFPDFADSKLGSPAPDLLFYGYDSSPQRMQHMANSLRSDVTRLWNDFTTLGQSAANALGQRGHQSWEKVLFVAHSLGTVVCRRAIIDALLANQAAQKYTWPSNTKLCLFAPAHSGSDVLRLASETLKKAPVDIAALVQMGYPCVKDLQPNSAALSALQRDYLSLGPSEKLIATADQVIFAGLDRVVEPDRFPGDPVEEQIDNKGHSDVCKPHRKFDAPAVYVGDLV